MNISAVVSLIAWVASIQSASGNLQTLFFQSQACQISSRQRIKCGPSYTNMNNCYSLGCCFQMTVFGPWCYYSTYSYRNYPLYSPPSVSSRIETSSNNLWTTSLSTTTQADTTTSATTPISSAVLTQNEVRKQSKPDSDLVALLSRLEAMHRNVQNKQESDTNSRRQSEPVSNSETIQASASGVVSSDPFARSVSTENETAFYTCSFNPEDREDCGYPGIVRGNCENLGCCWNSSLNGVYWCFYSILLHNDEVLVPPPVGNHSSIQNEDSEPAWRNNNNVDYQDEELIAPPLPPNLQDEFAEEDPDSNFLALVAQEMSGDGSFPENIRNSSTPPTHVHNTTRNESNGNSRNGSTALLTEEEIPATNSTALPTSETLSTTTYLNIALSEPAWLQQLLENHELTASTPTTTTSTSTTSTYATTTEQADDLPPYSDPVVHTDSLQNNGNIPPPTAAITDIAALLKILQRIEQQRIQSAAQQECRVDIQDECCRYDPTAPCCEYQVHRDLAHRAAPITRIVGGGPAGLLRFSVAYISKDTLDAPFCGGTLIYNQWVLTAAHCVLNYCKGTRPISELVVSLGKYRKMSYQRDFGQVDLRIIDVICHPTNCKSADQPRLNDLALLRLERAVQSNRYFTPAPMPLAFEAPAPSGNCIALGWGSTHGTGHDGVLKEVSVPLISNDQCNRPDWRNCVIRACMMCAGDLNSDPCDGDSGGPLFCQRPNGLYVLHGIYSWGRCGSEERKPAVYTRASYFIDWVNRVTDTFVGRS